MATILAKPIRGSELYNDYRHLHLSGKLLRPSRIKADSVTLTFIPHEEYNRDQWSQDQTVHIGTLRLHDGRLDGLFCLPSDVLPSLLTRLAADKYRFVTITSAKLRYGKAAAQDYSLHMNIDEDDMPPDS